MARTIASRVAWCLAILGGVARAQETERIPTPLDGLGSNMLRSAVGWTTALHVTGSVATWWMVRQGTDAQVQRLASRQDELSNGLATTPGLLSGTLTPVLLSSGLYFLADDRQVRTSGAAAMQAVGISFLYNNVLKAVTGRVPPRADDPNPRARSGEFHFGLFKEGVFYGWPSGHTMVNTAMATSLYAVNRDKAWALPAAVAYSAWIGSSMVFGGRGNIHCGSEAVAGWLMGAGIGWVVGDSYYRAGKPRLAETPTTLSALSLEPLVGEDLGMRLRYVF